MSAIGARVAKLEVLASGADAADVVQASWSYWATLRWDRGDPDGDFERLCGVAGQHGLTATQAAQAFVLALERLAGVAAAAEADLDAVLAAFAGAEGAAA